MPEYAELHCHTNYSFLEGASRISELFARAKELGLRALAVTDHDNLCGAMAFGRAAHAHGLQAIIGTEVTLDDGSHLTLLAESREGYANLCQLLSIAHMTTDRRQPRLDARLLPEHAAGLFVLSGCPNGRIPRLLVAGEWEAARSLAMQYREWSGDRFYLELQRNLAPGDLERTKLLVRLGRELSIPVVATNNVHYHVPERQRLQDCLVAIRRRETLERARPHLKPNGQYHLKSPAQMERLFRSIPEAIRNTLVISERCTFDVTRDFTYRFPDYPVPPGYTPLSYLEQVCREAAMRRYGHIDERVEARLREELRRVGRHNLAGFFLLYKDLVDMAHEVQVELGYVDRETPVELSPPGRGRGSSVAMLIGYLIGLSHVDPLVYDLGLDRFLPDEDLPGPPDIDLDFPRDIRERLIERVHQRWGWERAALTGMIATYRAKGAVRDLGLALGLPADDIDKLAKRIEHARARDLRAEMLALPEYRDKVDTPVWRDLIELAAELDGFPHHLAQHPGGMVISSTPLSHQVPVQPSAIAGRYIMQWDKDDIDDAGMVKVDFLALGTLSQMQEAVRLIEERTGRPYDLSRIDFEDELVYDMIGRADTVGVFQIESQAQMQTAPRLRPRNLMDMAREVAAVRPGVGANDGVTQYIRRRQGEPWDYDHPLEHRALHDTLGVILYQDQVLELAMAVAGFSAVEADQMRRAFQRRDGEELVAAYWERFRDGAWKRGVPEDVARRIFGKFNAHYMFPRAHAVAFGITAYQAAHLKAYYPLEFYTALLNAQPMGFYSIETIKEDARRRGIQLLHPDVNRSFQRCTVEGDAVRLGLLLVRGLGGTSADAIVREREERGTFQSLAELMERTGLLREALENLADAGALDSLAEGDRRRIRWEIGLRYEPVGSQRRMHLPVEQDMAALPTTTAWEHMAREYRSLGLHPNGHLMAYLREQLPRDVLTSDQVERMEEGATVQVAGLVIRRQRPLAKAVFITLEDEHGHTPCIIWPKTYERLRHVFSEPVLLVTGVVSRRDGTLNVVVRSARALPVNERTLPKSKDWG